MYEKDLMTIAPVAEENAAEFLRAQEIKIPNSIDELRQASESAGAEAEQLLGHFDRLQRMKEKVDDDDEVSAPESYDIWIDAVIDLETAFLEDAHGALGLQLLELVGLDDVAFEARKDDVRRVLQQTGNIAFRMYPSVHRLVTLGFAASRREVVEKLSAGELVRQERVQGIVITPRRKTIIGLLRDLDVRLPEGERTNAWELEIPPELPSSIIVSDPFYAGDVELAAYWRRRIGSAREVYKKEATILSLSGDKTSSVLWELENVADRANDEVLRDAAHHVAEWLEGKRVYYQDPDPRDFELYHLGMEGPETLMHVLRSLDVIKHFDPELFIELLGIDPSLGGRSMYFGSFLHKAIYNTQRTIDHAAPNLGEMAIRTMMHQLLTLDERVQTYSAIVSQESLKAMAGEMKKSVNAASTPQSKAQMLMMMAVPFSRMAIDAEVRRQLDALREASSENIVEELRRRIDDIEHPLKLADYLVGLPRHAVDDVVVRRELRKILSEEQIENGVFRGITNVQYGDRTVVERIDLPSILPKLYERIPLIDEAREDLGFALRVRVAIRDAVTLADRGEELTTARTSEKTRARQFLKVVMPDNLYREDFEAIKDQLRFWEIRVAERFNYVSRLLEDDRTGIVISTELRLKSTWSEDDKAFFIGQTLVELDTKATDRRYNNFPEELLKRGKEHRPDLVFLSVIAHPQGKQVAFKYFDKFCEMIPPERMVEMLVRGGTKPIAAFNELFERFDRNGVSTAYIKYLRHEITSVAGLRMDIAVTIGLKPSDVPVLVKLNRVLVEGRTPWEIKTGYRSSPPVDLKLDLFDVYESIRNKITSYSFDQEGASYRIDHENINNGLRNPDVSPPTEVDLKVMRACYHGPETSHGADAFNAEEFTTLAYEYFTSGIDDSSWMMEVVKKAIKEKICR